MTHTATAALVLPALGDERESITREVRMIDGQPVETKVVNTFRVESVDHLGNGNMWCRGTIIRTTGAEKYLGQSACAYIGKRA